MDAQADLSSLGAQVICWFCHAAAHLFSDANLVSGHEISQEGALLRIEGHYYEAGGTIDSLYDPIWVRTGGLFKREISRLMYTLKVYRKNTKNLGNLQKYAIIIQNLNNVVLS